MALNLVLIGVAVALDPLPLMAFLVVLPSKRGVTKGAAFVFGWLASLAIVVSVVAGLFPSIKAARLEPLETLRLG